MTNDTRKPVQSTGQPVHSTSSGQTTGAQTSSSSSSFAVDPKIKAAHPNLLELIEGAQSMNDQEKQYWLNLLPIMTPDQIRNLRSILETEKAKLAEIDGRYNKKMENITNKYLTKWTGEKRKQKRTEIRQQEETHQQEAASKAEDLLSGLE